MGINFQLDREVEIDNVYLNIGAGYEVMDVTPGGSYYGFGNVDVYSGFPILDENDLMDHCAW